MSFSRLFLFRELKLSWLNRRQWMQPLLFFLMVLFLFPFALSSETSLLVSLFPGLFLILAILAHLLSSPLLFQSDYEDGSISYWRLQPVPLIQLVKIKLFCHSILFGIMLIMILPLAMFLFQIPFNFIKAYVTVIVLISPTLTCLGGLASSLTLSVKHEFLLHNLIVLPLYIPLLIFATMALQKYAQNLSNSGELALLAAMALSACCFAPRATAAALQVVA